MQPFLQSRRHFATVVALGTFAMAARSVTDPDVWWHLRTGQLILQNHTVFHVDPYSFTRFGQPWVNHEWLADVTMYGLYSLSSWTVLIIAFGAIASTAMLLTFLRCEASPAIAAFFTVCGAAAAMPSWGARPQVLSFLLASIFFWILDCSERQPARIFWLIPLTLLWVNLHAGYAVGVTLLLLNLLGLTLDVGFGADSWERAKVRVKNLALMLAACIAIVPLNPYGAKMYVYPFMTLHSQAMQGFIHEWASPNFHESKTLPIFLILLTVLVLLAVVPRRLFPHEIVLLLAGTAGALLSVRHIPIFVLIAVPTLSRLMQAWLNERLTRHSDNSLTFPRRPMNVAIIAALVIFALTRVIQLSKQQNENEARKFPRAATEFLLQHPISGPPLNPYDWGGYLIWRMYPQYPVFIDGRADVYGDAFMNEVISSYSLHGDWLSPLGKWQIQFVLLPPQAPLTEALRRRGWTQLYADSQAVILRRAQ